MKERVFHLLADTPFDIMEALGRLNPKVTEEEKLRGAMILEETFLRLRKGMNAPDLSATVKIKKRFGDISVELTARGEAVNPVLSLTEWVDDEADLYSVNVLKANRDCMGYARRNGANVVSILIHEGGVKTLYLTALGLAVGLVLGGGMETALSAETLQWLEKSVTAPIATMFMTAIMMARVFDKPFTVDFLLYLTLYVFIFAYTMPPLPGAGLVAQSSVFAAIGVPPEAVILFLCVEPICDMVDTVANVGCNVASALLLAKKFDMWDEERYRKESF